MCRSAWFRKVYVVYCFRLHARCVRPLARSFCAPSALLLQCFLARCLKRQTEKDGKKERLLCEGTKEKKDIFLLWCVLNAVQFSARALRFSSRRRRSARCRCGTNEHAVDCENPGTVFTQTVKQATQATRAGRAGRTERRTDGAFSMRA